MYHIIQSPKKRDPMSNTNVTLELLIKEQLDPLEHIAYFNEFTLLT